MNWRKWLFVGGSMLVLGAVSLSLLYGDPLDEPETFSPQKQPDKDFLETVRLVNEEFDQHWSKSGPGGSQLQHALPADELTVIRRLALGLAGTAPSLEEIRRVEALPKEQRVEWYLSHLLEDRRFADHVGERLARAFVGNENGPFLAFRRRRFVIWLSDRVAEDYPYDQLARDLIAGDGLWTDSPQVNYITVTLNPDLKNQPDPVRLASRTTRAFLGARFDCVQCHDENRFDEETGEPVTQWKQEDFHQLAAFFASAENSLAGIRDTKGKQYKFKYHNSEEETVVPPQPPFNEHLFESERSRRDALANWITHNENRPFARTIVNRVWALMFGRPLTPQIDSIPMEGPFPPGMEPLVDDFIEHGYRLKRLIRLIAATQAFQLDSRADFAIAPEHEENWAVFPLTRLRPEQVSGALLQSASLTTFDANTFILFRLDMFGKQTEFIKRYGDMGEDEFVDQGGAIPQRLLMMNGQLVKERTEVDLFANAATRIAAFSPNDETAVETAYLAVLTRRPTAPELNYFVESLGGARKNERARRLEDMYWSLLNSSEFSWNH